MKISKFQIIVLSAFVVFIVGGVLAFALYKGNSGSTSLTPITVWGTFPASTFNDYVSDINSGLSKTMSIKYVQESQANFYKDFVNALARGVGPDVILVSADMILPFEDKLTVIPYKVFSERTFMDSYIGEAGIYLSSSGELAVPFMVDPLVMYWNRDTFNSAGLATYPKYWDEFVDLSAKLTNRDQNDNIRKSAISMGSFSNITNARELLGSLLMQSGSSITGTNDNGLLVSTLADGNMKGPISAVSYFSQFADPSSPYYSWNKGMPVDKSAFLAGTLATYFGFASELKDIKAKNPNLNYDVAPLPQLRKGGVNATYGKMYGFSLVASSANNDAAFQIISILTQPQYISSLANDMYLPTPRNDLISQGSLDPYISVFNDVALISKTWIDADPTTSKKIFGNMIDYVISGQRTLQEAVENASDQYDAALKQAVQ